MRASRLVQLLLILQTRGRCTAGELAKELEVSVRTVYRDVEALSAAGVPVYSEPGRAGGVQLVDGYRTRLTGLTTDEADAVLLAGLPGAAADLGLGTVLATAQLKVLAALPPELRGRATRIADRVHIDAPGWFRPPDETPTLSVVADALWHDRRLRIRYGRKDKVVDRRLDPLGLVMKAGTWYLVAQDGAAVRSYRVSRIVSAEPTGESFTRPADFDLAAHWSTAGDDFALSMLRVRARCRMPAIHLPMLRLWHEPVELTLPSESYEVLAHAILPLGEHCEVLEPPELRARIAQTARRMHARYNNRTTPDVPHPDSPP